MMGMERLSTVGKDPMMIASFKGYQSQHAGNISSTLNDAHCALIRNTISPIVMFVTSCQLWTSSTTQVLLYPNSVALLMPFPIDPISEFCPWYVAFLSKSLSWFYPHMGSLFKSNPQPLLCFHPSPTALTSLHPPPGFQPFL